MYRVIITVMGLMIFRIGGNARVMEAADSPPPSPPPSSADSEADSEADSDAESTGDNALAAGYEFCSREALRYLTEEEKLPADHPVVQQLRLHLARPASH